MNIFHDTRWQQVLFADIEGIPYALFITGGYNDVHSLCDGTILNDGKLNEVWIMLIWSIIISCIGPTITK